MSSGRNAELLEHVNTPAFRTMGRIALATDQGLERVLARLAVIFVNRHRLVVLIRAFDSQRVLNSARARLPRSRPFVPTENCPCIFRPFFTSLHLDHCAKFKKMSTTLTVSVQMCIIRVLSRPLSFVLADPLPEHLHTMDFMTGGMIGMPEQVTNPDTRDSYQRRLEPVRRPGVGSPSLMRPR